MATKKDLVEAYSFSKRRLVTAFLSGAPGGREVEPSKPGRTIIGGVALAVLLTAGAAVTGVFKPRTDAGWQEQGLVTSKERATDYVILEPEEGEEPALRPLINITSAMLLFDADVEATRVPEKELKTLEVGEPIGILNAPGSPPDADDLIQEGWTACTGEKLGVRVTVTREPQTDSASDRGFLVKSDGSYFLIAEGQPFRADDPRAYAYPVPEKNLDDTDVRDLTGSIPRDAVRVPADWVALFPTGDDLHPASLGLGDLGERVDYAGEGGLPADAQVGDWYRSGGRAYALSQRGPVELSPFGRQLLESHGHRDLGESNPSVGLQSRTFGELPEEVPTALEGELCAELTPDRGRPVVSLAGWPTDPASASGVPKDEVSYEIESGGGAYVRSGPWDPAAEPGPGGDAEPAPAATEEFLIDSRGRSYLLQGSEVAGRLGYGGMDAPVAPAAWVKLFEKGVTLSVDAAACPPERDSRKPCR